MDKHFPVFPVGTIFCEFQEISRDLLFPKLKHDMVTVKFPVRLNGMSIDSSVIAATNRTSFPAGEIFFSINEFISVTIYKRKENTISISGDCERTSLIKHACLIMCRALKISPCFEVIIEGDIQVHSGFGTSGATIGAVCAAINEMYDCPIKKTDLIKYIANNYGEEIQGDDANLKLVQCIGGSAASGFTSGGITIIAGNATPIISKCYESEILIATPFDFHPGDAKYMMELEEQHLAGFEAYGRSYSHLIAYDLLHKAMPLLMDGDISEICNIIFRHRFEMGSIKNCSFVYPRMLEIADKIKFLYIDRHCKLVSLSSVGPAFFVILDSNERNQEMCATILERQNLNVHRTSVFNGAYIVNYGEEDC